MDRCDQQIGAQEEAIANLGGILRCDPSYDKDESPSAIHVMQWDHPQPIWWLWADTRYPQRLDDYWLQVDAWVGVYELDAYHRGRVPVWFVSVQKWGVPADVERDAYTWAAAQVA